MSAGEPSPSTVGTSAPLSSVLRAVVHHRGVHAAIVLWIVGYLVVLWFADGVLPFDRPAVAHLPFATQMAQPTMGMIEVLALMLLTFLLTRKRVIPDMAARAPSRIPERFRAKSSPDTRRMRFTRANSIAASV